MFGYSKEAVRVKVKKCEGKHQPEQRKFSVDPQITSLEVLQSILIKAFDIRSDFTLSFKTVDDYGQEVYLPLLSDWDLDAAFLKAHNIALSQHSEPCVQLKVDMKPFAEASEDWEPPSTNPNLPVLQQMHKEPQTVTPLQQPEKQENQSGIQGLIMNQVEKTFNIVSRALNLYEDPNTAPRPPLSDIEFRSFLDTVGQINNTSKLREVIYCGGIDPSLRKVVWKHILNVYPDGMTGKERMDFIKKKANEYYSLRACWKECIHKGKVNAELAYVTSMVRKDVLRTDRHHTFYAGSDDNQNIASLFNILTTYALNHPTVSYCQGMSDLASPLLVTMGDEAHAYICLCALMARLHPNFLLDGEAMTLKFTHLTESLQVYDPDFYNYLKSQQADDLLFCYRWLLLEMKREFAFDDALRMLEVLWASLPHRIPASELSLKEKEFDPTVDIDEDPPPLSPLIKAPRENAYTKVCAMRRQSSSFSLANVKAPKLSSTCKQMNHSLDENATRKKPEIPPFKKDFKSLDDAAVQFQQKRTDSITEKSRENNLIVKDNKQLVRGSMTSVPENDKNVEFKETETTIWSSTGNLTNGTHSQSKETPLGSQVRSLRDKISDHNNKFFSSLDKLDRRIETDQSSKPKVRMIKNLSEFLKLATVSKDTSIRHEKLQRTHSAIEPSRRDFPRIILTKTSFDEGDLGLSNDTKDPKSLKRSNRNVCSETNDGSSPDDSQEYYPMTTSMTRELRLELEHLDRQVFGPSYVNRCSMICDSLSDSVSTDEKFSNEHSNMKQVSPATDTLETRTDAVVPKETTKKSPLLDIVKSNARSADNVYLWENPLHKNTPLTRTTASCPHTPDEQAELDFDCDTGEIIEEHSGKKSVTPIKLLRKIQSLEPRDLSRRSRQSSERSSDSDSSEKEVVDCETPAIKAEPEMSASRSNKFFSSMSQELENAKKNCESLLNAKQPNLHSVASTINNFQKKYEAFKPPINKNVGVASGTGDSITKNTIGSLPPPTVFGGGNPFLMFLCLTVLLQHRDYIMRNRMDYNELAMHFDKMVRKHNVNRVLNQARQLYAIYLKHQAQKNSDVAT